MKLEFRLLIVDDSPESISQAILILEDHLKSKGFSLETRIADDLSVRGLRDLARLEGKDYDLVIVDYNLGQFTTDGAAAALQLRQELKYTDIVFYSSDPELDLHDKLSKQRVSGVFVARRDELSTVLTGLTDTVIGKAVDLNHTRGIGMAEVAEMDVLMEETLKRAFRSADDKFVAAAHRTLKKLRADMQEDLALLKQRSVDDLPDMVCDGRQFSSAHKYQAVRRVARSLPEKPAVDLKVLESYQVDIIDNRNMLAHAKEHLAEDGKTILRSIKSNKEAVIDDSWMASFRQKLKENRVALTTVCEAVDRHIATAKAVHDSEKH